MKNQAKVIARHQNKLGLLLASLCYLGINSLFVIKYGSRLQGVGEITLLLAYLAFAILFAFVYNRINLNGYYKLLFVTVTVVIFAFSIYLNSTVDGHTLNVDRWSAMEVGVKALLNGEYPYSAIDHLGGRTSNLPTLIFLGIPFYFLGGVGYLQSFCFLVFVYIAHTCFSNYKDRLFCLSLLSFSPAYLWELYAKSDLMSNFILLLLFLVVIQRCFSNERSNGFWKLGALSFLSTALVLTRLVAVIPLSLALAKRVFNYSIRQKTIFALVSLVTAASFAFLCFHKVESMDHLKAHNPFSLQNRQLPLLVSLFMVLAPVVYAFYIKGFASLIRSITVFMTLPTMAAFLINVFENGLYLSVIHSAFDISYFNIAMPFLLIALTTDFALLNHNEISQTAFPSARADGDDEKNLTENLNSN